jgi:hypothetical protein
MNRRGVVTELGPDRDAARDRDRDAILFDVGLGLLAVDAYVRTSDPEAIAMPPDRRRASAVRPCEPHRPSARCAGPHRVFLARIGRIVVYAPIPGPGGTRPERPHTHVLPKLLHVGQHACGNYLHPGGLGAVRRSFIRLTPTRT